MFFGGIILIVWMLICFGSIVLYILYLLTLSRTLELCHPHTRKMSPGEVWMVFIPLFGIVWHFIMIGRIAESLAIEFRNRNLPTAEDKPGYQTGMTALILMCCGVIPFLGLIAIIVSFIFLIMYWNKIKEYKNQLEQHNLQYGGNPFGFQPQASQYPPQYSTQYPPQGNYPTQYPPHGNYPPQYPPQNPPR